jgi:polyhydroxyalkanoate synthesis regulator phasin
MRSVLDIMKEEGAVSIGHLMQETKMDMDQLKGGIERVGRQVEQMAADAGTLKDKIREDVTQVKEELGPMIRFSYADLEKKIAALEARIQALENMIFH